MACNVNPIYARQPHNEVGGSVLGPTAVTLIDGTGATPIIYMADTTNGSWVDEVRLKPVGSPAATVVRIFYCTSTVARGSFTAGTTNTAANTALFVELTLASASASNSVANNDISIPIRKQMGPGEKLLIGFGTSTGSSGTGYAVTTFGGDY